MIRTGKWYRPLQHHNGQKGFTLSEVMLTLSIWAILLICFIPISHNTYSNLENKGFLEQFKSDIQVAQRMNMEHSPYFYLFLTEDRYYLFDSIEREVIYERTLPEGWRILPQTITSPIRYNHEGTLRNPGTLRIITSSEEYLITFPFGVGGPVIEQQ